MLTLACLLGLACGCGENKADNSSKSDTESTSSKEVEKAKVWLPGGLKFGMTYNELADARVFKGKLLDDKANNGYLFSEYFPEEEITSFYSSEAEPSYCSVIYYFDKQQKFYSINMLVSLETEADLEDLFNNVGDYYTDLTKVDPKFTENFVYDDFGSMEYDWNTSEMKVNIRASVMGSSYDVYVKITDPKYKVPEI